MLESINSLPQSVITSISLFITQEKIQSEYLLRDGVFSLLDQYCTVLYYPQEKEDNDGCHVRRLVNGEVKNFVYINTYKSVEKQVFTAAHELGHILELDKYLKEKCPDYTSDMEEMAMNKFAAFLLMPESLFNAEIDKYAANYCTPDGKITLDNLIKFSLQLMDFFFVPFKSVIIRLFEVGRLSNEDAVKIIKDQSTLGKINDYITNLGYKRLGIRSKKKSIKDFSELLDKAEQLQIFPVSKIQSIRNKMDLTDIDTELLSNTITFVESKSEN